MESLENSLIKQYRTGDLIIKEGDFREELYLLLKGKVELFTVVDNEKVVLENLTEGSFFGETTILEKQSLNYSVRAIEESSLIIIDDFRFKSLFSKENTLAFKLLKNLSSRLRFCEDSIKYLKQRPQEKQEIMLEPSFREKGKNYRLENRILKELSIIPPEHKSYLTSVQPEDTSLIYQRKTKCPLCEHTFEAYAIRNSRLILEKTENDLRQRFKNIEPLWYLIWVCPKCNYANLQSEFEKPSLKEKLLLQETTKDLQRKIDFSFSNPRLLDEIFKAYYIALHCTYDSLKMGKIWLRLSWLYDDVGDQEMLLYSQEQALRCYKAAYYKTEDITTIERDQHLTYIIGDLSFKLGEYEEARKYFYKSIVKSGGSAFLNRQARIRLDDVKSFVKKNNK